MENSHISWTDHTFNPWMGCTKVSPGCKHCYAETLMDTRYGKVKWGKGNPRVRTSDANWKLPLRWNRDADQEGGDHPNRPRVFCASLADWLDEEVPIEWLADLLMLIQDTPNLDWLLLTKRPENFETRIDEATERSHGEGWQSMWTQGDAPANVWVGTSVEDQRRAQDRIPALMKIPAKVRFLSVEPMLEAIDLYSAFKTCWEMPCKYRNWREAPVEEVKWKMQALLPAGREQRVHWVICGGESGQGCRAMNLDWARSLRDQCIAAGVPFHFKQIGGVNARKAGRLLDGREWNEFPKV